MRALDTKLHVELVALPELAEILGQADSPQLAPESFGEARSIEALASIIRSVRQLSKNRSVRLLVGGRKRRPDLYDRRLRLVVEAESFAWHGERRQLEIAMVLATDAQVLLLDEPLAGMGSEESASMVEVLKRLRQTRGILLVEHDMDAVFAVADMITVMVNGQLLECGPPAQIKASVAVQQAYLGTEDSFHV